MRRLPVWVCHLVGILCLVMFVSLQVRERPGPAGGRQRVVQVGLPFSPWFTYEEQRGQSGPATFAWTTNLLSWSMLAGVVAAYAFASAARRPCRRDGKTGEPAGQHRARGVS
ncbi:MAG TPA: hypothetical protein VFU47_11840 [Armatimonadota bacterium]|nr:hypothetical protein [Armatimonadota bacterium]